ncbi:hypothetical protein Poli38472_010424 [Pythium oligandrum]|uniref:Uncharacterized protein n=1 Tax=Pythium oligandrum TaxID=41045 RepID=A0A8K1C3N1_PYTOL|nr:hypothetical protein Poli38472_010424 [Pythium oligandrum]|eukprot:TMW55542.1 hypothetical protein Poli38472_010424 [Pythium oligandrum]
MKPMLTNAAVDTTRRPRAFGRTSNVWQYMEAVQERMTPSVKDRRPTRLNEDEEEEEDRDESPEDDVPRTKARKLSWERKQRRISANTSLKSIKSLPELPAASTTASPQPTSPSFKAATPASKRQHVNTTEIMRRLQSLGTSASMPALLSASPVATAPLSPLPHASVPPMTATMTVPASNTISDAEKMRNDFNSQSCRLYYGCSVAFELFNGHLMMVNCPDGHVGVQALESMHLKGPSTPSGKHRMVFTLIDLADLRSANPIRYGDAVYLQLSVGTGEMSWELGGVLGAKVREAPQLKTLALHDDDIIRNDALAPATVGYPVPIKAYLPKTRDDLDAQVDEMQSRVRNKASKMLGKWIIRSAVVPGRRRALQDTFVYNNDEVYFEQDWFYLAADSDAGRAVLRQLPSSASTATSSSSSSSSTSKDATSEYVIERRAAWRVRLLDSSGGGAGLTLAQQQMERLLFRAKSQLKQSRKNRAGHGKRYGQELQGGAGFVTQLRSQLVTSTKQCDAVYSAHQERRLSRLPVHFDEKAELMEDEDASDDELRPLRRSTIRPTPEKEESEEETEPVPPPEHEKPGVCALCQSASIGYGLCSQIHDVINVFHAEQEEIKHRPIPAATITTEQSEVAKPKPGRRRASVCMNENATDSRRKTRLDHQSSGSTPATLLPPQPQPPVVTTPPQQTRMMDLFAQQDQHLIDVIKYKEKAAITAATAEEHARIGLSPVGVQFRDRFKHVSMLMDQHQAAALDGLDATHGIGGHFLKLHVEIKREETMRREELQRQAAERRAQRLMNSKARVQRLFDRLRKQKSSIDEETEDEDDEEEVDVLGFLTDTRTCPIDYPGDDFDPYGQPIVHRPKPVRRVFPTDEELQLLPPMDTKKVMELYIQNKPAVVEMVDGFIDLVQTHIQPNLAGALSTRNRGALVEFLDFTARAAEFVCARRVQVRVAQLLHKMAETEAGDIDGFKPEYERLGEEFASTLAFMRFYRDSLQNKRKKKL